MAVHKLMGRDASKCLKIVGSNSKMGPHQSNPNIDPNIGCLGAHFLLSVGHGPLPLWTRSELFLGGCGRGRPHGFKNGDSWGG